MSSRAGCSNRLLDCSGRCSALQAKQKAPVGAFLFEVKSHAVSRSVVSRD